MTDLERMKITAELMRVQAARAEMQYIIAQRQDEISKLSGHIKIQEEKELELKLKLDQGGQ